ncbi:hypothetical protein [Planctomicrobium sp. SH664]|uniref:hypothetical protein n=1 Tax=Planctomicrobium sp. SH664 TaxID=3448125 RepID=UPI003F5C1563
MTNQELHDYLWERNVGTDRNEEDQFTRAWFTGTENASEYISHVANMPHLVHFSASRCNISNADLQYLRGCSRLKSLVIQETRVTGEGLLYLPAFPELHTLTLTLKNADAAFAWVRQCPNLKSLYVHESGLTDDGLRKLAGHPLLTEIDLRGNPVNLGTDVTASLPALEVLCLAGTKMTDAGVLRIAAPKLHTLWSEGCRLTDKGLEHFGSLTKLHTLSLEGEFTERGFQALATLPHLETLYITDVEITDGITSVLCRMSGLKFLQLAKKHISRNNMLRLRFALKECEFNIKQ